MEVKLKAEGREGSGKGPARRLRAAGKVPAVVYGHGMDPVSVTVDVRDLYQALHTGAGANVLVDLKVGGKEHLVLAREIQRDYVRGTFVHVDFLAIRRDQKITVDVPVRVIGESPGVKAGGVVEHHLWDLSVECLPGDVPEAIEVDISTLELGDGFRVASLELPSGATMLTPAEETILAVVTPQVLKIEEEEEAAAEEAAAEEGAEEGVPAAEGAPAPSGEAPAPEGSGGEG